MRLLEPYFLYAFLALAIPILIHLFSLQRHKTVFFSNVAFLKQLQEKKKHFSKIQNLVLLLLRLLLISSIIIAFCQPYISDAVKNDNKEKVIGIYLDNSFSMEADNDGGILIDIAKNKSRTIVDAYKSQSSFVFLNNNLPGKLQRIIDRNTIGSAIDETDISSKSKSITSIIDRWNSIIDQNRNYDAELFIISDFQKSTFEEDFYLHDTTFTTHLIPISAYPKSNISIDTCFLESPSHFVGGTEWLYFKLTNESDKSIENLAVKLIVNGQQMGLNSVSIPANSSIDSKLSFNNYNKGTQNCVLEINDASINFDNKMYLTYEVVESKSVLNIYENENRPSLNHLFDTDYFDYETYQVNLVQNIDFSRFDLIILQGLQGYNSGLIQDINDYVSNGGHLCLFPAEEQNKSDIDRLTSSLGIDTYSTLVNIKTKVNFINDKHHLFLNVFEDLKGNISYPLVNSYFKLSKSYNPNKEIVLGLSNQNAFVNSYKLNKGNVYLFTSPLSDKTTNFEDHALVVPLLQNMALLSSKTSKVYYTIGETNHIELDTKTKGEQIKLINETLELIPEVKYMNGRTHLNIPDVFDIAGFYDIKSDTYSSSIAFNYNRLESKMTKWDNDILKTIGAENAHISFWQSMGVSFEDELIEYNQGKVLWHFFILAALVLILIESIMIKNWKKGEQQEINS